jgi:hypothetical protein
MTPLRWITDQRIYEARRLKPSGDFGGYAASASRVGSPTSCSLSGRIQLDSVSLSACAVAVYIAAGFADPIGHRLARSMRDWPIDMKTCKKV